MKKVIFTLCLLINVCFAFGNNILPTDLPLFNSAIFNTEVQHSGQLQYLLEREINKRPNWKNLVASKRMAVGIMDISNPYNPEMASVNGDHMMYAASLPKIAVLLAAMDAIDKGQLKNTPEIQEDMWLMISKSNNQATTRMIDRVGFKKISSTLQDPNYKLYDRSAGGGLWVGKRYAAAGARNPDPMKGLSHAATADQVLRFYKMLAFGELVNSEKSAEMLSIMMNPSLHHKFVHTLDQVNPSAKVFRKSGSWKTFHSDSAIVWGKDGRKYILVALIDDPAGEFICRNIAKMADQLIEQKTSPMVLAK